jgi:hypothetical protein
MAIPLRYSNGFSLFCGFWFEELIRLAIIPVGLPVSAQTSPKGKALLQHFTLSIRLHL